MTRIAVVQPALELGQVEAQPRADRGSDPRRPSRARRRGDRRPRGVHDAERLRQGPARHATTGRRPAAADARAPGARARLRARRRVRRGPRREHLRHVRARRARRRRCTCTTRTSRPPGSSTSTSAATTRASSQCAALGCAVGLMSGWEWARFRTAARVRARRREARARRDVLAVDAAQLARAAALVGAARARDLAPPGAGAAGPGRAPHRRAGRARLARRPGARRNAARARDPVGDADARRVADLRPRRHGARAPVSWRTGRGTSPRTSSWMLRRRPIQLKTDTGSPR